MKFPEYAEQHNLDVEAVKAAIVELGDSVHPNHNLKNIAALDAKFNVKTPGVKADSAEPVSSDSSGDAEPKTPEAPQSDPMAQKLAELEKANAELQGKLASAEEEKRAVQQANRPEVTEADPRINPKQAEREAAERKKMFEVTGEILGSPETVVQTDAKYGTTVSNKKLFRIKVYGNGSRITPGEYLAYGFDEAEAISEIVASAKCPPSMAAASRFMSLGVVEEVPA
ncbi:hypothetical protein KOR42_22780 [Thalassoglobus neptunius]|uniref:Uncharacterized protein n=1 Tax=Thalassoglobus neptunius TaxID=1938619 RepID=A0A5C5X937_9PLAN|nr:hypothetical protein [Thalassoglobus neptunius]TWT58891.1 hypothetical protein KOR42_22780 [Thalassoglobus neptunius]